MTDTAGSLSPSVLRLLDGIEEAMIQVGPDGRILAVNGRAERLLGAPASRVLGLAAGSVLARPDGTPLEVARAAPTDGPQAGLALSPDGTQLPVSFSLSRPDEGPTLVILRDDRLRREAERRLQEARDLVDLANRTKTEFVANMSHELRTPLNAILGFAEIVRDQLMGPLGNPIYAEYARDIHDSGSHLLQVINDILDLAKVEAGHMTMADAWVAPSHTVASCLRLLRERAARRGVGLLDDTVRSPGVQLRCDERKLRQMLINVIGNAIKFTPDGGVVRVGMAPTGEAGLAISVSDTGIGIAPEDFERVLAPFGQAASSLDRPYEGTGLGLPLTRALVELHGGRLEIESALGRGTTVRLVFPADRVTGADGRTRRAS